MSRFVELIAICFYIALSCIICEQYQLLAPGIIIE